MCVGVSSSTPSLAIPQLQMSLLVYGISLLSSESLQMCIGGVKQQHCRCNTSSLMPWPVDVTTCPLNEELLPSESLRLFITESLQFGSGRSSGTLLQYLKSHDDGIFCPTASTRNRISRLAGAPPALTKDARGRKNSSQQAA